MLEANQEAEAIKEGSGDLLLNNTKTKAVKVNIKAKHGAIIA
jgi:hypothetical protein